MQTEFIANQLSAISTALEDSSLEAYGDLSPSAVAALLTMKRTPTISIGIVAEEIKLSHSATVRLIDRLERDWLVRRLRRRGRQVMVELTVRGKRKALELAEARLNTAASFMKELTDEELAQLSELLDKLQKKAETPINRRFCLEEITERELENA